ncbi:MAG: ATP-dependent helicase HrpB [Sandaracinaceae bacterium]|nr:ATP-dependent helicase HrpB [Sandaracinaceae bacterium]
MPPPTVELPIDPHLPALVRAVRERGLVLVAEPGAGKTTRLPRALLDAGIEGEILVVEPRRIAARMAAARVAEELGEKVGHRVGYRVRFESKVSSQTRLTFVTEGLFMRRLIGDPALRGVGCVVFDELHERHLDTDLGLARARRLQLSLRSDLRLVAMSATLEAAPVARFLDVEVREVEGRVFPIAIEHDQAPDDRPLERRVRAAFVRLLNEGLDGDALVFLPGAAEIRRAMESCAEPAAARGYEVLPLHGDLPSEAQDRAVRPLRERNDNGTQRRKLVLSTNVAETSLTIDGVVAVIDSGLHRQATFSPWSGLPSLSVAPISQASAAQRAGRAGRTRPGRCVRLYTKADHDARPARDRPEIKRSDLCELVLALGCAGEDPRAFPYFEPPPAGALDAAERVLIEIGAMDERGVTAIGHTLLSLPIHPRLGRLVVEAARRGHAEAGATIAALIAEREVRRSERARSISRERGGGRAPGGEVAESDLIARLHELDAAGSSAASQRDAGLDPGAVQTVRRARDQILRALEGAKLDGEPSFDEEGSLLLATLAAFPDRVAKRRKEHSAELILAGGGSAELDPESAVQAAELVVCVDAREVRGKPRVRLASATSAEQLLELFPDRVTDVRDVRFDPELERVVAFAELRYPRGPNGGSSGGLVLDRARSEPSDGEAAEVLARAAESAGLGRFLDADELDRLRRRLRFASVHDASVPALEDEALHAILRNACVGRRSFAELRDASLLDAIRAELGASVLAKLDRLAPDTVAIAGRPRVRVSYELDRPPWIESRLQDFFGTLEGPRVAGGRVPLVLHLLAPNQRAVQVTTDLAGFWQRHYPEIRKELMRRYPRHHWPEDPRTAEPKKPRPR